MNLLALQRDFRDWLTEECQEAGSRLETGDAPGLSVYLNNYRSSLMACLRESFTVTHAWLGDEAFDAAAATHIDRLPPHSWTLDAYALDFPATLASRYPADPEVADLARLELALGVAFIGADADPLDPATLSDADWDTATLRFVPTLDLIDVSTNAASIWSAITVARQPPAAQLLFGPASIAVWRSELAPAFRTLERDEDEALRLMRGGLSFGALCARLVGQHGEENGPSIAGTLLGRWFQDGLVASVSPPAHR
ncbi:HvfC/BufC N-terminal domain-containing protein [Sphingomonas oryzagri]|uniref:DNA-binding domain-containing protein n=1 Tax=Sphingomonas oryzagri TaxID=3042314 RepID=A0ABT6N5R9_9SPHN|nr:DNA-binding domain-containing protein [Sphingomonas oryzagri]MDH7640448.1 DNA-binding domain-containing protein [Sphingomonas oryzagri]